MSKVAKNQSNKSKFLHNIFDVLGSIFRPILSIIIGAGILQALRDILLATGAISQVSSSYIFLNAMGDGVFYFLPIFLAFSAAKVFGASEYMAASVAAFLVYPAVTELFDWSQSVGWNLTLFGVIPVTYSKYPSSVLPIILIVWVQSYLERLVNKIVPNLVKAVFVPVLTLFGTAFLGLTIFGPIGTWIGNLLSAGIGFLNTYAAWLVPTVVGTLSPLLVLTGSHYSLFPLATQNLAQLGYDTVLMPGNMASNLALAGCSFAVSIRTRSKIYKSFSASAGVTSLFGISQSSLYGVAIPLKRTLYAAMIAGGGAGFFAGITQIKCHSFVTPGLLSLVGYFSEKAATSNLIYAILTCIIAFAAGFVLTLVFSFNDPDDKTVSQLSGK
jgi:PTS system beta-glucosides-specific IIC component